MAELFEVLALARPQDAAEVLRGLDDETVVRVLERAEQVLPVAVSDHLIRYGSSAITVALAKNLRKLVSGPDADSTWRGLLRRLDPATDEVLFAPRSMSGSWWIRRAILRDRRGPDGRVVIAPGLRASILAALAEYEDQSRHSPNQFNRYGWENYLRILMIADDPDLVEAALPDPPVSHYFLPYCARGLLTLHEFGRLSQPGFAPVRALIADAATSGNGMWRGLHRVIEDGGDTKAAETLRASFESYLQVGDRLPVDTAAPWGRIGICSERYALHWEDVLGKASRAGQGWWPALDEAAYREDCPPDVRALFEDSYATAVLLKPRPDRDSLLRAPEALTAIEASPAVRHRAMRSLIFRGLESGTLDPVDVVMLTEPAAEAIALAVPDPAHLEGYHREHLYVGFPGPGGPATRGRAAIRAVLAEVLRTWIGDDPRLWDALLTQAAGWPGSLESLVKQVAEGVELPVPTTRAPRWPRGVDAASVLLSLAPAGIAESFVAGHAAPARRGLITRMLDREPLSRALVEHALGPDGTSAMRFALARNPETSESVLWRLIRRESVDGAALSVAYFNGQATEPMRVQIILRLEASGGLHPRLSQRLSDETAQETLAPVLASKDPVRLHAVLRRINNVINPLQRARAYATVAEQAGPEVVWALDLERAGSLTEMAESVRASMASGDAAPLIAAAAIQGPDDDASDPAVPDVADGLDQWRLADLIREHLDDRPERWRALIHLTAAARPNDPAEDLVRRVLAEESG